MRAECEDDPHLGRPWPTFQGGGFEFPSFDGGSRHRVRYAMSRSTSTPVTPPLESWDTSITTPFATLPFGYWTSVAEMTSVGWKETCAKAENPRQISVA